jgi:hypothetical protein
MAVRRSHFKDAILVPKDFGRIHDLNRAIHRLDHRGAPTLFCTFGDAINRESTADYNTDFYVFIWLENKRLAPAPLQTLQK